jgi:type I restriction enzyme S subunit
VNLGDRCAKIGSGSTPRGGERVYQSEGTALIRSQNVYNGFFAPEGLAFLGEQEADRLDGVTVEAGDVLLNITGDSVARCCQVPEAILPARVNQHVAIVRPRREDFDARFLMYFFISPWMQSTMLSLAGSGGTRKALTKEMIQRFKIPKPPLCTQTAIGQTLSSYDLLMDNNQRRMRLLEDSATQLYREWFVRLRFPGHEHTHVTHGIPDGWTKTHLKAACIPDLGIQTGPFGSQLHQSDYSDVGIPVVMPKDILASRISTDSIARVPETVRDRLSRHVLQAGDIVLARRGDIGRKAFVAEREAGWLCGTGCMRLRADQDAVIPRILFDTIGRPDVMGIIVGRAQGAIMPNLNLTILRDVPIILAPIPLQRQFMEYAEPIHRIIEVLAQQNERLKQARDLLLPRLMSGEIAV